MCNYHSQFSPLATSLLKCFYDSGLYLEECLPNQYLIYHNVLTLNLKRDLGEFFSKVVEDKSADLPVQCSGQV